MNHLVLYSIGIAWNSVFALRALFLLYKTGKSMYVFIAAIFLFFLVFPILQIIGFKL